MKTRKKKKTMTEKERYGRRRKKYRKARRWVVAETTGEDL